MLRLSLVAPLALLVACGTDGTTDTTDTSSTDTGDTADTGTDSGDTDTGDTDTGDTDTGDTHDTSDTSVPPLPDNGYFGPPTIVALADDGAGGAKVFVVDTSTNTATAVADLTVSSSARFSCAGQYIWVLSTGTDSNAESAYGIDGHNVAVGKTLELPAKFAAQAVMYSADTFWVGGDGSASVVSYGVDGTAGSTIDLSSLADADGLPEVRAFVQTDSGVGVVLSRENTNTSTYEASMVAILDLAGGSITSSGSLNGGNAGRADAGVPGGVLVDMQAHGSVGGGLELFDTTSLASGGTIVDFTGVSRVATIAGGSDGTVWVAATDGAAVTVHHYLADGTDLGTVATHTEKDALAVLPPNLYSGEGTGSSAAIAAYDQMTGTAAGSISIGSTIYRMQSCQPPPMPPDTGDTAGGGV